MKKRSISPFGILLISMLVLVMAGSAATGPGEGVDFWLTILHDNDEESETIPH